jgi:hypothetical protein
LVTPSDKAPDAFVEFVLRILIFDQRGVLWVLNVSLIVTSTNNDILGTLSGSTTTGTLDLSVYSRISGTKQIKVTAGSISGDSSVSIQQNILQITSVSPSTLYTESIFTTTPLDCTVCVLNSQSLTTISSYGPFTININALVNTLTGTLSKQTSNGCVSFTSLKVSYIGTTRLQVMSTDKLSSLGGQIKVKSLTLSLSISPSVISSNFDLNLTATVYDETGFVYTPSLLVSLTGSSLVTSSIMSSDGIAKFTFRYSLSGTYSVEIACQGYVKTRSIEVKKDQIVVSLGSPKVNDI